ncbi:MAG: enoyl-CoA hydratase/isomerase family protein [Candidatus Micrarchaeota archaeon]|nr:enoyl-CoA hydratase/isomerase family protein [Candidatus Micrarchaeota archaeon]MDE1834808.1 enoyl-CoA hydratase/isomerase family protein [Candidatus Micrarchaeota archaeon]MDE1859451.1 enoyl-CoA hydratase/isomerase family protein [Candidatus Micrarchaeota archaeon]
MDYKSIIVSISSRIATITLNRPDKLNSIDGDMIDDFESIVELLNKDSCRAVIITGAGERAFCAGADINYLSSLKNEKDAGLFVDRVHSIFNSIEELDKPVIAAINGYCLGGGCELALACDIRIASPNSVFGQPEVRLGIIPGGGGTYRLTNLVGIGNAKELIMSGDTINASEAYRIGLLNKIVDGNVLSSAKALAMRINQNSHNAVKNAKSAINANAKINDKAEKDAFLSSFSHPDRREGVSAFLERSKPDFE